MFLLFSKIIAKQLIRKIKEQMKRKLMKSDLAAFVVGTALRTLLVSVAYLTVCLYDLPVEHSA